MFTIDKIVPMILWAAIVDYQRRLLPRHLQSSFKNDQLFLSDEMCDGLLRADAVESFTAADDVLTNIGSEYNLFD